MKERVWIGIDIGSISLKMALYYKDYLIDDSISKLIRSQLFFKSSGIQVSNLNEGQLAKIQSLGYGPRVQVERLVKR